MKGEFLPYLEWEVLREPITIPNIDDIKELPKGQKKIVITRDEHYNLRVVLSIKSDPKSIDLFFEKVLKTIVPGSFVELFEITGSDQNDLRQYTLESCHFVGIRTISEEESLCEADLSIQGLKIRHKTEAEGVWLTEWYINGPRDALVFSNSTMRKMSKTFFRERSAKDEKIYFMEVSGGFSINLTRDFLRIEANDLQFLISQVPK
ncbi:MAG: hypothetical protein J7L07_00045 [Candidatus Odinarchaeota archaeon]|nr:hypothetical protein [Candidatus Odinarchaeota archaeon]